jgi:hypothetical protein
MKKILVGMEQPLDPICENVIVDHGGDVDGDDNGNKD